MVFVAGLGVKVLTRGQDLVVGRDARLAPLLRHAERARPRRRTRPSRSPIAIWGWALASRGYNTAGGVVWGLFAFKPVWALAFCIVPLLTRRWRFCAAMVVTGVALCAATLPFVGLQTWFDWLSVGKEAAALYNVNQNWINLSRDLQGIPRRILHDFNARRGRTRHPAGKGPGLGTLGRGLRHDGRRSTCATPITGARRASAPGSCSSARG